VIARRLLVSLCLLAGVVSAGVHAALAAPDRNGRDRPDQRTIDEGMAHLVTRAVAEAKAGHARAIVLDVNTFGGLVQSGTEIRDALFGSEVPVYAYVERAWSAGALVSLAASRIVVEDGGSIGSAQPIRTIPRRSGRARRVPLDRRALSPQRDARRAMVDTSVERRPTSRRADSSTSPPTKRARPASRKRRSVRSRRPSRTSASRTRRR